MAIENQQLITDGGFPSMETPSGFPVDPSQTFLGQVRQPQLTADRNDYPLPPAAGIVFFSTDASRAITGFAGAMPGVLLICNEGANDLVIANDSASSAAQNRVLCHTGGNITLGPNMSVEIFYDFTSLRWRTKV